MVAHSLIELHVPKKYVYTRSYEICLDCSTWPQNTSTAIPIEFAKVRQQFLVLESSLRIPTLTTPILMTSKGGQTLNGAGTTTANGVWLCGATSWGGPQV